MEWLKLFFNFIAIILSGGLGGALILFLIERKKRKVDYLKLQIEKFYGPLYFLTQYMLEIFKLHDQIGDIERHEFSHSKMQEYSDDEQTRENLIKKQKQHIDLMNEYVGQALKLNYEIQEIIQGNIMYADSDLDYEHALNFCINFLRNEKEIMKGRSLPLESYLKLGKIKFYEEKFFEEIKKGYETKKKEYDNQINKWF